MRLRILLVAVVGLLATSVAHAAGSWWNNDWGFRKEIAFNLSPTGGDVPGSVKDAPVLVRLSTANFAYFGDAKPDGADFRVVAGDDKTPLKFHFERYDAQNQMAFLWVRVPMLTGGAQSDKVYVYYGNSGAEAGADVAGSYDVEQALVLHFGGDKAVDATAYANNPTTATAEVGVPSLVAGGAKFSGSQSISVPATASLRLVPTQGLTASTWVKIDAAQTQATVLTLAEGARELVLGIDGLKPFARLATGTPATVTAPSELATGAWHHLAVTVGGDQLTLYVDGSPAGSAPVQAAEIGGALTLGASASGGNGLVGELDEVSVAKTARTADYIKAQARSQGMEAPLVAYGEDGQKEGGQTSYFGTIAKNLTVDGWVIIVICFVMLIIAMLIMILKALYLSRVEKANKAFLAAYHELKSDVGALDSADSGERQEFANASPMVAALIGEGGTHGASTLFSIYHEGVREMNRRIGGATVGARHVATLSPNAIEAIRASLDATATRLQQRLSANMVLLTIAISGGPFLGLLGTVIGVMITFAAIAAAGDVNVNAIAPGTAAALAATVAGLAVAIPALFGYNWLNARIKSITSDNRVFLDEFVARLAEEHG